MQLESIKESIGIISAAIIGSFIGTASKRDDSAIMMIVSVVAGISSAYIFTPILSDYFNVSSRVDYAIAFLLGLLGMSIISILMSIMDTLKNNPKEIIGFVKDIFLKDKTTIINNYNDENK
jgi:biotin transporter BioY